MGAGGSREERQDGLVAGRDSTWQPCRPEDDDAVELIVLLDDDGTEIGTMPKRLVHHGETPLHRAFSAYLFDDAGQLLVTRRASDKETFPGMWTNTVCGHPGPGEGDADAIARRASDELGLQVTDLRPALPDYRYRAELFGIVENEICPVYLGTFSGVPAPAPGEVGEWELLSWAAFRGRQAIEGDAWSPWCREQAGLIERAGLVPAA